MAPFVGHSLGDAPAEVSAGSLAEADPDDDDHVHRAAGIAVA